MSILIFFAIIILLMCFAFYGCQNDNIELFVIGSVSYVACYLVFCAVIIISTIYPVTNNDSKINTYAVHDYTLDNNGYCVSYFTSDTEMDYFTTKDVVFDENIDSPVIEITTEGTVNIVFKVFFPWTALTENFVSEAILHLPQEVEND